MDNIFGYGSGSSAYDKRRHYNCVLQVFCSGFDRETVVAIHNYISTTKKNDASSYLNFCIATKYSNAAARILSYIKEDLAITQEEIEMIITTMFNYKELKTPAGYKTIENTKLLMQMFFATFYMPETIRLNSTTRFVVPIMKSFFDDNYIRKVFSILEKSVNKDIMTINKDDFSKIINNALKSI